MSQSIRTCFIQPQTQIKILRQKLTDLNEFQAINESVSLNKYCTVINKKCWLHLWAHDAQGKIFGGEVFV